jgi:cyclopropane fatty-acyl-phospholipid synthase-like methyltransferase
MVENRYDNKLREGNQLILDLTPGNYVLRIELSLELSKIVNNNMKILEIGSGEGDLTKYILMNNQGLNIDILDVSKEMIDSSKKTLAKYAKRINFINKDALDYLEKTNVKYDIITSSWTFHNFVKKNQIKVFERIYASLVKGGKILLMDKFYSDDADERKKSFDVQIQRYRYFDSDLRKAIAEHEKQDISDDYRMDESKTIAVLSKLGFKNIKILDRVERDILLVAEK